MQEKDTFEPKSKKNKFLMMKTEMPTAVKTMTAQKSDVYAVCDGCMWELIYWNIKISMKFVEWYQSFLERMS
jgi:hypothetical protein